MVRHLMIVFLPFSLVSWAQVTLHPTDNVPMIVSSNPASTTFIFTPGTYRLSQSIIPKNNDQFIGQTSCAPPTTSCSAIISGGVVIGPSATFDGTNYEVADQTQQGARGVTSNCDSGWLGCIYPEDLFFDGVPYQHLYSPVLPTIGPGQWWFDYTNHIIYFHDNPSGHTVETSVLNNAFGGTANHVTIQHLTIEEFADMDPTGAIGLSQGGNALTQGANWTVENCEVTLNHGAGVRVGYGIQILNNYIHNNGQVGIGGGIGTTSVPITETINSGIVIQGNTITYNDYAHFNPGFGSGGFKDGATSGIVLRGNIIQHNEGSGIHFDVDSQNELVDGNTITDNSDADGLVQEIGDGTSTFRNNVILRNGAQVNDSNVSYQVAVRASTGVNAYCNVMEVSSGAGINGWGVGATNRGYSSYPPYQYHATTGNSFHHNTVIWDSGASGSVGFFQNDPTNQPNFFADNTPPDYNTYHLSSLSANNFIYDNNNSQSNTPKTFAEFQAAGADVHGTADTNYTSGFPTVAITSPPDQSSSANSLTVTAVASDTSGISKVEFYVDWALQGTVTTAPYNFTVTGGLAGLHTVAAMAYSNAGIRTCYAVTVNEVANEVTVVSSASFTNGPLAPESLATAFGKNLATGEALAPRGESFPTTLDGTTVSVQDASGIIRSAELLYASPEQVNFVIPAGTSTGTATVTITAQQTAFSNLVHYAQVQIALVAPAIFMLNANGLAAAYVTLVTPGQPQTYESVFTLQNGSPVAAPISLGPTSAQAYLTLYGTGLRNVGAGGVTVDIQGLNAPVISAGPMNGIDGLDQVTALVPRALAGSGDVSIVVTAAGVAANTVGIVIQ